MCIHADWNFIVSLIPHGDQAKWVVQEPSSLLSANHYHALVLKLFIIEAITPNSYTET